MRFAPKILSVLLPGLALLLLNVASAAAQSGAFARPARVDERSPDARRPNVVFILIDDMGFGDLSLTGNQRASTSNIDRIAADGRLFSNFYQNAPVCSASRAAIFTGRYQQRYRINSYLSSHADNAAQLQGDWLPLDAPSLARGFKSAGYATAHIGKWHLGGGRDVGEAPPVHDYGFDEVLTSWEGLGDRLLVREEKLSLASAMLGRGKLIWKNKHELTEAYVDRSIEFIRRQGERPFYLQLWLNDVHDPWKPDGAELERVSGAGRYEDETRMLAVLVEMDRQIGRLMTELDRLDIADETIVILTSDNGPTAWPRYYKEGDLAPGSTAGMRGRKWSLYEGGIRVPLIVRWPGRIAPGTVDDQSLIMGMDLLPTLAGLAGFQTPAGLDGADVAAALTAAPIVNRPPVFWEYGSIGDSSAYPRPGLARDRSPPLAMRDGDWKLLSDLTGRHVELYDLKRDPNETHNVASVNRVRVQSMLPRLLAWRRSVVPSSVPPPARSSSASN